MGEIKEKVIELFEDYFNDISDEYEISKEQILYLKKKIKNDIEEIIEK